MKNYMFVVLLLIAGCKSAELVSPEICATQVERYMKVNLLKADKCVEVGINLEGCCQSKDFEACAWNQISTAYNLEFDKAVFDTTIVAWLNKYRVGNAHVLLPGANGCIPDHQKIKKN